MASIDTRSVNRLSIVSTVIDALLSFRRGRTKSGAVLLGAAALSSRVPGLGTATSLLLRAGRRLR